MSWDDIETNIEEQACELVQQKKCPTQVRLGVRERDALDRVFRNSRIKLPGGVPIFTGIQTQIGLLKIIEDPTQSICRVE